jgi:hypothetical protein
MPEQIERFVLAKSPKALIIDFGGLTDKTESIPKTMPWLISKTPEALIWMFAEIASLEVSLVMGRACGFLKDQPKIMLHDYDDAVTVDIVATSLLEVRCGDVVVVDGNALDKIANVGLFDLFVEQTMIAGCNIVHSISAGQKKALLECIRSKLIPTTAVLVIYRDSKDVGIHKRGSRFLRPDYNLLKIEEQLAQLQVHMTDIKQSMSEFKNRSFN